MRYQDACPHPQQVLASAQGFEVRLDHFLIRGVAESE
jgi:hypothetical protein